MNNQPAKYSSKKKKQEEQEEEEKEEGEYLIILIILCFVSITQWFVFKRYNSDFWKSICQPEKPVDTVSKCNIQSQYIMYYYY